MTNVSLDTSELRPTRRAAAPRLVREAEAERPSRLLVAGGVVLGIAVLAGAGFGAYSVLGSPPAPRSRIQFGPLAEMPDIRDGVPAVVRSAPANLVERRTADLVPVRPVAVATPQSSERSVAAALSQRAAPPVSDPSADAANARAMASTLATASLRPGFAPAAREPAAPVRIIATKPVPSAPADAPSATVASLEPAAAPASVVAPAPVAAPVPAPAASPAPVLEGQRRDVGPIASIQASPPPARTAPREPVPTPSTPRTVASETPPLPPARRVSRAFEASVATQPAPRQPPAAGARQASAPTSTIPATARAVPQDERAEIFGLRLPGFVPTGRQIRDAAGSVADAVTSIPDVF